VRRGRLRIDCRFQKSYHLHPWPGGSAPS
jgi:hypothetical protein